MSLLAELGDPDLFDWCVMCLDDPSREVRVAALETMCLCEEGDVSVLLVLGDSQDKSIRAAAIAAIAQHAGSERARWVEYGLKDPPPCVRLKAAGLLPALDPLQHRTLFELALYDPNPDVARWARQLTAGKGLRREEVPTRPVTAREEQRRPGEGSSVISWSANPERSRRSRAFLPRRLR